MFVAPPFKTQDLFFLSVVFGPTEINQEAEETPGKELTNNYGMSSGGNEGKLHIQWNG